MGITAKAKILARLSSSPWPLRLHQFNLDGVAQTSISARCRELRRDGLVTSVPVPGARDTAWILTPKDLTLPLSLK